MLTFQSAMLSCYDVAAEYRNVQRRDTQEGE